MEGLKTIPDAGAEHPNIEYRIFALKDALHLSDTDLEGNFETNEADEHENWKESDLKYLDSFSEVDPEDADYIKVLRLIDEFLPVKELAGRVVNAPVLRQFGLVENEKLDRFLATAFGQPRTSDGNATGEPRQKRSGANAKVPQSE